MPRTTPGRSVAAKSAGPRIRTLVTNRQAPHEYHILETVEAGLALQGTEVKSIRAGNVNLRDAYARAENGEIWLWNAHIAPFDQGNRWNHEPRRPRKLLLHRKEVNRLLGAIRRQGVTLVPLSIYFNDKGRAKVALGLARGKRKADKRQAEKTRDWRRDRARILRARNA